MKIIARVRIASLLCGTLFLVACGGGDSSSTPGKLSGSISGLTTSGLTLKTGSNTVNVAENSSSFVFAESISGSYSVSVSSQPKGQTCAVGNASGTMNGNIGSVTITCRDYMVFVSNTNTSNSSIASFQVNSGSSGADGKLSLVQNKATSNPVNGLAITAYGKYLYASYEKGNKISTYSVSGSGLVENGSANAQTFGYALATNPAGTALYSADYGSATISQFSISGTGTLSSMSASTVASGVMPTGIATTPDGQYAYVINSSSNSISQYAIGSGGALAALTNASSIALASGTPTAIAVDPNSRYVYVTISDQNLIAQYVIGSTGALTLRTTQKTGTAPNGLAVSPDGNYVYVVNSGSDTVSQYMISSGYLTTLSTSAVVTTGSAPYSIAIAPYTPVGTGVASVYVVNRGNGTSSGSVYAYTIASNGTLSFVENISSGGLTPTSIVIR